MKSEAKTSPSSVLQKQLAAIHKKGYPAYKSLQGAYGFPSYTLSIDHVQGDPFAAPSKLSVHIPEKTAGFPRDCWSTYEKRIALQDFLTRKFSAELEHFHFKAKGSGKSGLLSISRCGQEILERTACEYDGQTIIVRFEAGFPANGRTINADELAKILFEFLPKCVERVCFYQNLNPKEVESVLFLAEDQTAIRAALQERGLVSFVADGSILPRETGVSARPLKASVPFESPASLKVTLSLPHRGMLSGMGIPKGVTLIVGGGYHGKSTLLNALEAGVYNHIAGDGREYVITDSTALKLRAEDGRSIRQVDISLFINDLPNKKDTRTFSTPDASGSTSQAANVMEGIEAGSRAFLIDEDTSATNFMVRDEFMQQIITRDKEPITPFLERVRDLYEKAGISTILVAGSSGAYFHAADTVIQMDTYRPLDITERVRKACKSHAAPALTAPAFALPAFQRRLFASGKKSRREDRMKIKTFGKDSFQIDGETVDLRYVEQLMDAEQTAALARILAQILKNPGLRAKPLTEIVSVLSRQLKEQGLSSLSDHSYTACGLAMPRLQEIYACLNRYRG